MTLIIVTHDSAQAARFHGRLLSLQDGKLLESADTLSQATPAPR
jgi:ABC-type phosphate transport system ATPase subunit